MNDLSPIWIKEEINKQRVLKDKLHKSYNSIQNTETDYAKGIYKMWQIRCEIIDLMNRHC